MKILNKNFEEIKDNLSDENIERVLKASFVDVENSYIESIKDNYKMGFGKVANVGSCVLCAVVINNKIFVSNLGDSKGIIIA